VVYFGGFFAKLEFSRGFLYIFLTGRNSEAAMGGGDIIFFWVPRSSFRVRHKKRRRRRDE
jgi:hypothetical protein